MRRLLLVPVLLFALAACGGDERAGDAERADGGGDSSRSVVLAAATATAEAGSYRSAFELSFDGLSDEVVTMSGEGIFATDPPRGRMSFDMSELGRAAGQDFGRAEFVFDADVVYMSFPAIAARLPEVEKWIRFDLRDLAGQFGADLGELAQINQSDPSAALEYLRAASGRVQEVGTEEVRGVQTTRYRMVVDLEKVAATTPGQRANSQKLRQLGVRDVPTEVWVDAEGRARRLSLAYAGLKTPQGPDFDMTMQMDLYDFGVEVDVKTPPTEDVTDLGEIIGRGAEETEHSEPEGS